MLKRFFKKPTPNFTLDIVEFKKPYYVGETAGDIYTSNNIRQYGVNVMEILPKIDQSVTEVPVTLSKVHITNSQGSTGTLFIMKHIDNDFASELKHFAESLRRNDDDAFLDITYSESSVDNFRLRITIINLPKDVNLADVLDQLVQNPPDETKVSLCSIDITEHAGKNVDEKFVLSVVKDPETELKAVLKEFGNALNIEDCKRYESGITLTVRVLMTYHKKDIEQLPTYIESDINLPKYVESEAKSI